MVVFMASDARVQNFGGWVVTIQTEGRCLGRYYYCMVITSNGMTHLVPLKHTVAVPSVATVPASSYR